MKFIILILLSGPVFACKLLGDQLNPVLKKKLDAYDQFIVSLQNEKDPIKAINKRIKSDGILLDAYISEKLVKNYPSSFDHDSVAGARKLFLRNMKLPPGLSNDLIYEVDSHKAKRPIRSWQIPANQMFAGIKGNEILYRAYLSTPCSEIKRDVLLAVSPKGSFRAVPDVELPETKRLEKCPAAKNIFKTSAYDSCIELQDLKSRKKRIIVYQSPMT